MKKKLVYVDKIYNAVESDNRLYSYYNNGEYLLKPNNKYKYDNFKSLIEYSKLLKMKFGIEMKDIRFAPWMKTYLKINEIKKIKFFRLLKIKNFKRI